MSEPTEVHPPSPPSPASPPSFASPPPPPQGGLQREAIIVYGSQVKLGWLIAIAALGGVGIGFGLGVLASKSAQVVVHAAAPTAPHTDRVEPPPSPAPPATLFTIPPVPDIPELDLHAESGRIWLGVLVSTVAHSEAEELGLSHSGGAIVQQVYAGSPAERAGLRRGDIIVEIDGDPVRSSSALVREVLHSPAGKVAELRIIRDGALITLRPELEHAPRGAFGHVEHWVPEF